MQTSTIDRVRAAELAAVQAQQDAQSKAGLITAEADKKAQKIISDSKQKAQSEYDALVCAKTVECESAVEKARTDASQKAQGLRELTLKKQELINKLLFDSFTR